LNFIGTELDTPMKFMGLFVLFLLGTLIGTMMFFYIVGINDNIISIILGSFSTTIVFIGIYALKWKLEN